MISSNANFFTCLPPEKLRDIAFIPSVLERVQRCQVSYDKIYKRSHYVMLQNFSISTNRCPANMAEQNDMYDFPVRELSLRNKTSSPYFLPSFDNPNGHLCQRRIVEIQKSCHHGNLTSHFSCLISLFIPSDARI